MSVLGAVFDSLKAMSLLQLLLAFLACIGYAVAQGRLVGPRGRRVAWAVAVLGSIGFVLESGERMYAAMLLAFAIAGLGVFVAMAWLTSRMLGFARSRAQPASEAPRTEAAPLHDPAPARSARPSEPAHST